MFLRRMKPAFILVLVTQTLVAAEKTQVIDIGSRRELFVDCYLIDKMDGARLKMHTPQAANVALQLDKPWEGLFCGYFTVIKDADIYRMYYRGLPAQDKEQVTCMAVSRDGIVWERPSLRLHKVEGTLANNVILRGEGCHNFSPFIDMRPGVEPDRRYKALGLVKGGLAAFGSPDGIHWSKLSEKPVLTHERHGEFDSQNVAFWSESENCYVCYFRKFVNGVRHIGRATSTDFITWSDGQIMGIRIPSQKCHNGELPPSHEGSVFYMEMPREHLYTNQTQPYFRAPHIYLSFPMRFRPGRAAISEEEIKAIRVHRKYAKDVSDGIFMTSRGGLWYDMIFPEAFFRPGLDPGNWVSRTNMAALGVVPTGPGEISMYYSQHYAQPSHHIRRYTLRIDGFVSLNAGYFGGEMITKPFRFAGNKLTMNYSTSAAGEFRVELQDMDGKPIPGFSLADCPAIFGDRIDATITWKKGADVSSLAGKAVRMRLVLRDADIYSFKFCVD